MNIWQLTWRNIKGSGFRSLIIFFCVLITAVFFLSNTLIIKGAQNSLNISIQRLGADIVVVPSGAESKVETALLMGKPTKIWMPEEKLSEIAAIPGVETVSPQIYLSSLYGASCCSVSETFLVVYDPQSDFTLRPWLEKNLGRELDTGEIIGGFNIFVPPGEKFIRLYGSNLTLKGNLEATGTGIDQTIFFTMETAKEIAKVSLSVAESPLEIPDKSISAAMVKVAPGVDAHHVAMRITLDTTGMVPLESPNMFGLFRQQMTGLLWGLLVIMIIFWILSAVLIGLVFSMAANERRREIAVLRAIGATRNYIFRSILTEAGLMALIAAVLGIMLAAFGVYLFRDFITSSLGIPFLFPDLPSFMLLVGVGTGSILGTVILAALLPALRLSRHEPAVAMRE